MSRIALFVFLFFSLVLEAAVPPDFESEVRLRLDSMACLVEIGRDEVVLSYLNRYLIGNRERSQRILGRSYVYFPEIEALLREHGMPVDLKYLAVVESALYPEALSRVGAAGIWQFMKETGRSYGLEVNSTVDERYELRKATLAAIEYLRNKHQRFGSWALALAAYNSGAGRVSRAIKRGRSKNFWRIRRYLPRETRNYVPAFIAATYLFKYYQDHGLKPEPPSLDLQLTERITVYQNLSFGRIAQLTGLDLETIAFLNPAYRRGYIPASRRGYPLVLPRRVILAVVDYLNVGQGGSKDRASDFSEEVSSFRVLQQPSYRRETDYLQVIHGFGEQDCLSSVAAAYGCSPYHLLVWNGLRDTLVAEGAELTVYLPAYQLRYHPELYRPLRPLPSGKWSTPPLVLSKSAPRVRPPLFPKGKYYCYVLPNEMSLLHLVHFFGGLNIEQLIALNKVQPNALLPKGFVLKIRPLEAD